MISGGPQNPQLKAQMIAMRKKSLVRQIEVDKPTSELKCAQKTLSPRQIVSMPTTAFGDLQLSQITNILPTINEVKDKSPINEEEKLLTFGNEDLVQLLDNSRPLS